MKRISLFSLILVAIVSVIVACNKKDNVQCTFVSPEMVFVNFTQDDLDTIIIRKYPKDNNFTGQIDTTLLAKGGLTYTMVGIDSITVSTDSAYFKTFTDNFYLNDWEIYIPSVNYTSRIKEIKGRFFTKTDAGEECRSFVVSMNLEGSEREFTTWFGDSYRFFITKEN